VILWHVSAETAGKMARMWRKQGKQGHIWRLCAMMQHAKRALLRPKSEEMRRLTFKKHAATTLKTWQNRTCHVPYY
jgi:hypothetical protein